MIDLVCLQSVARKWAGGFSLGIGQRLGIAAALHWWKVAINVAN